MRIGSQYHNIFNWVSERESFVFFVPTSEDKRSAFAHVGNPEWDSGRDCGSFCFFMSRGWRRWERYGVGSVFADGRRMGWGWFCCVCVVFLVLSVGQSVSEQTTFFLFC